MPNKTIDKTVKAQVILVATFFVFFISMTILSPWVMHYTGPRYNLKCNPVERAEPESENESYYLCRELP